MDLRCGEGGRRRRKKSQLEKRKGKEEEEDKKVLPFLLTTAGREEETNFIKSVLGRREKSSPFLHVVLYYTVEAKKKTILSFLLSLVTFFWFLRL